VAERRTARVRMRAAGSVALLSALCAGACANQEAGEVMLVVSTDLSLPSDLNWLEWSVTPLAHPERVQTGGIALDSYDALPATLAVVAGQQPRETVSVRISGRTGGERGPVRVTREARFTLPEHGPQTLNMPLNWLCSDVNQLEPCGEGMTCDAGRCVSSASVVLSDQLPSQSTTCFDVLRCNLVQTWIKQTPDLDADTCILEPKAYLGSPLNVALEVNTENVGNAGVCAPGSDAEVPPPNAGSCFIPLAQNGGTNGWDLIKNKLGQTVIRLPRAVCDPPLRNSIASVAVTRATCPSKHSNERSCEYSSVCVPSPASCPKGMPSTWSGYSCSGAASPIDEPGSGLKYCGVSDADPELNRPVRGHYCCTEGQVAGDDDPLLIDDMTGGPLIKFRPVPPDQVAGSWFTASDDDSLPLSPPQTPHTLFTYREITPAVTPTGGPTISRAACFRMQQGLSGYYALEGFSFYGSGAEATALDVSRFSGISFWAKLSGADRDIPQPMRVLFPNRDTDTQHPMSTCLSSNAGKENCDSFGKRLDGLNESWQKYEVYWTELKQSPGAGHQLFPAPWDTHVYSVDFQATGPGPDGRVLPFDFCVSQISFLE